MCWQGLRAGASRARRCSSQNFVPTTSPTANVLSDTGNPRETPRRPCLSLQLPKPCQGSCSAFSLLQSTLLHHFSLLSLSFSIFFFFPSQQLSPRLQLPWDLFRSLFPACLDSCWFQSCLRSIWTRSPRTSQPPRARQCLRCWSDTDAAASPSQVLLERG